MAMRWWCVACLALSSGCVATSLGDHTVNQAMSITDLRYQEVVDNLAIVAHNDGTLPSFAVASGGVANVTNTFSADATTIFSNVVNGFAEEVLNAFGTHNPELNWTVDPVVAEPLLEGLRDACVWAIHECPPTDFRATELLREPRREDVYGCLHQADANADVVPHLGVASELASLPPHWLHIGSRWQVPRSACYKSHCGNTYVWVTQDGLAGLSAFTLIVLDIATIDPTKLRLPQVLVKVEITPKAADSAGVASSCSFEPIVQVAAAQQPKSETITEQWYACQEPTPTGQVMLIRPWWIRPIATQIPEVGMSNEGVSSAMPGPIPTIQSAPPATELPPPIPRPVPPSP
jgi:hypothetical protein